MILDLLVTIALADEVAVDPTLPPYPEGPVPLEPAPPPPPALPPAPDPRALRLTGFVDSTTLRFSPRLDFAAVEHRYRVVDAQGQVGVDALATRLDDKDVRARRRKEATFGAVLGTVGLALGAGMLIAYGFEEVNEDPVLAPVTAITGVGGAVVGIGALGSVLQSAERPWLYWDAAALAPKLDAWNTATLGPGQAPAMPPPPPVAAPAEPAPTTPAPLLPPFEPDKKDPTDPF